MSMLVENMDRVVPTVVFTLFLMTVSGKISVKDHGYEGVVVGISSHVYPNPDLLPRLEDILVKSSAVLFRATKNQLYFREFVILLPQDWPYSGNFENALDDTIANPDIVIDRPNVYNGVTPYVLCYRGCSASCLYMHITPDYILANSSADRYGSPGKVVVHEWAHYRWGVQDEYPRYEDESFYIDPNNKAQATRCSLEVEGEIRNVYWDVPCQTDPGTGLPNKTTCYFSTQFDNKAVASLMYGGLNNVFEFCDDPAKVAPHLAHNPFAPNAQNKLCNGKSVWEVLWKHSDFTQLIDVPALSDTTNTRPTFRYVKALPRKTVLVKDLSHSMKGKRLVAMTQAATAFIVNSIPLGSWLGLVVFSESASNLTSLVEVRSDADKEHLIRALPAVVEGWTSIGAGLRAGAKLLSQDKVYALGGSIILITDGEENREPWIREVEALIIRKGIVVHAIAIGQKAEESIGDLADKTAGTKTFYNEDLSSTGLLDAVGATVSNMYRIMPNDDVPITLRTDAYLVTLRAPVRVEFSIDSTIGRDTVLTFSYENPIDVSIEGPNGFKPTMDDKDFKDSKIRKISLRGELQPGRWSYLVRSGDSSAVVVNVQSQPRQKDEDVMRVFSWISEKVEVNFNATMILPVYASVMRGKTPILQATVIATVDTPSSKTFEVHLFDNGIGPDVFKGDGVYSANIIAVDLSGDGRYNIKVNVVGSESQTRVFVIEGNGGHGASAFAMTDPPRRPKSEPLEDFQRMATAGEFRIKGFQELTKDELPPARITDLAVRKVELVGTEVLATLTWTAVGGDMERGRAARYVFHTSYDPEVARGSWESAVPLPEEDVRHGNLTSPSSPGGGEEYSIKVPAPENDDNTTMYLSIVAVDEANNEGEPSNLVILSYDRPSDPSPQTPYLEIGIASGLAALFLFGIGQVILYLVRLRKRKSESENQPA